MLNKINFLYLSISSLIILLVVHFFNLRKYYTSDSADFDSAIFEPSLNISLGLIATSVVLLFSNQKVYKKWLKHVFSWFLPLSLMIIFTTDVYGGIPQPSRTDTAALFSIVLVLITIVYTLVQRLYFKVK